MNSKKKLKISNDLTQSAEWDTALKYRDALSSKDMIAVSDDDQYDYQLQHSDNKNGELDVINNNDMIDPDQPEGVNEKQAMTEQLMNLLKNDSEHIAMNKEKIEIKNKLLFLQQEQEKYEMKKHFHYLMNQRIDKNDMIESDGSEDNEMNINAHETMIGFQQNNNENGINYMWNDVNVMEMNNKNQQISNFQDDQDEIQNKSVTLMGGTGSNGNYESIDSNKHNDNVIKNEVIDEIKDDSHDIDDKVIKNKSITLMGIASNENGIGFKFKDKSCDQTDDNVLIETKHETNGSAIWNEFVKKTV